MKYTINCEVRMARVCLIQSLEERIGVLDPRAFDTLWAMDYHTMGELRDKLIIEYNQVIEARKFAAEMIYER